MLIEKKINLILDIQTIICMQVLIFRQISLVHLTQIGDPPKPQLAFFFSFKEYVQRLSKSRQNLLQRWHLTLTVESACTASLYEILISSKMLSWKLCEVLKK